MKKLSIELPLPPLKQKKKAVSYKIDAEVLLSFQALCKISDINQAEFITSVMKSFVSTFSNQNKKDQPHGQ